MQKSFVCGALAISALFAVASCATGPDEPASGDPAQGSAEAPTDPTTDDPSLQGMEVSSSEVVPETASQCPLGWFCLWQNSNFSGRRLEFKDNGCQNLDAFGFNDEASSWYNHTGNPDGKPPGKTFWVYWDAGCPEGGKKFKASPGARSASMGSGFGSWNDNASSICSGPSCK